MKHISIYSITILLFLFVASLVSAQDKDEKRMSFKVKAGGKLELDVNPGDIEIETWNKNEVQVWVSGIDVEDEQHLDVFLKNNIVYVKYLSGWGWSEGAEFSINIPANFKVDVKTTGGDIVVSGKVNGDVTLNSSGGDISTESIDGDVSIATAGGDVTTGNIEGELKLKTQGGDIETGMVSGDKTYLTTMGGNIDIQGAKNELEANTFGGDITVGKIGGRSNIKTFGGDISIQESKNYTSAETYGGDIEIQKGTGEFNISTQGGDLELLQIKGSGRIKTNRGGILLELLSADGELDIDAANDEIVLRIPSNIKATIIAEITGYGWSAGDNPFEIISDFEHTTENLNRGNKNSTFNINGGGNQINLRTSNANIRIEKLK